MDIKNSFVIFGRAGCGKSTFATDLIRKIGAKEIFAIDFKEQIQIDDIKRFTDVSEILEFAKKKKNAVFIIDDASGNLRKGNNNNIEDLKRLLSVRRHDNNYYIFVFHSIYYFPTQLEPLIDFFIFFDLSEKQKDFERVFVSFEEKEIIAAASKKGLYNYIVIKK